MRHNVDLEKLSVWQKLQLIKANTHITLKLARQVSPLYLNLMIGMRLCEVLTLAFQAIIARELINSIVDGRALSQILVYVGAAFVGMALQNLVAIVENYAKQRFSEQVQLKVNADILAHAATLELSLYNNPAFRDLLERVRGDLGFFISHFITELLLMGTRIFELVSILILLVAIDITIIFLMLPFVLLYLFFSWRQSQERFNLERNHTTKRRWTWYFQEILTAPQYIAETRLLNLAPLSLRRYLEIQQKYITENHRIYRKQYLTEAGFSVSISLMLHIAIGFVILRVVSGVLTIGDVALYLRIATRLRDSLHILINSFSLILKDVLHVLDWQAFMAIQPAERPASPSQPMPPIMGTVEFRSVTFRYTETSEAVLKNVSFQIQTGEIIAVVGENGAGKTTLARLLAGLYQPTSGEILIDGQPLGNYPLQDYQRQVGYVFQEVTHYESSAHESIAFGDWQRLLDDESAVQQIAQHTGVDAIIQTFPQGYQTHLGLLFGDFTPSGGQWQRLSVARAFAKAPRLLILDEPTANLDIRAEQALFKDFRALAKGCTSLLISHRLSSVHMADRILTFERGQLVEQGTHDELMQLNGVYATLYLLSEHTVTS